MKKYYEILGVSEGASHEEMENAYNKLKEKYSEERFLPGEKGNDAAVKLTKLEEAWGFLKQDKVKQESKENSGGNELAYIDDLIKQGKYNEAQEKLDAISGRTAEWHYLQSIIFYKREWLSDSKTQLQMAVNLDPYNTKYRSALDRLEQVMGNPTVNAQNIGRDNQSNVPPVTGQQTCGNSCANICACYILTDCCCSLLRCL